MFMQVHEAKLSRPFNFPSSQQSHVMKLQPLIMVLGCVSMPMCLSFGSGFWFCFKLNGLWIVQVPLISLKLSWLPWWNVGGYQRWMWQKSYYFLMQMGLLFGGGTRVITQIKDVWVPFSMGVHCVVHRTNLVIQSLSNLTLFVWVTQAFMTNLHGYFLHS